MEMLHTALNRGCSVWDKDALPSSEFHNRIARIKLDMKQQAVDLLLVYGDSWRFGDLAFVSHFIPKNRGALTVIPLDQEPALVIQEPSRNNPFSSTLTWIEDVRSVGQFAQGVGQMLEARGLKPKRVGLVNVEQQLNIREWNGLVKLLDGVEFRDLGDVLRSLRCVKSAAELRALEKTASILDESLAVFERQLRSGKREYEVAAAAEREARRRGVEGFYLSIARSTEPRIGLHPPGSAAIQKADVISVAVAACCQRYWAELGRTFSVGGPSREQLQDYEATKQLFRSLRDGVRVGVSAAAVGQFLSEVPHANRVSLFAYGLGNGIGLDMSETPILAGKDALEIQKGMVLTLRICAARNGFGHGLIAQPFVVGDKLKALSRAVDDLVVVEG
ncbi:MAG TPA: M24 family metallopeptidase [Verrucomicrobiae bacterium]|jgi:Xaa-Pro aminopeptidase|nr:M24 family metallopeptidase [Verrucomicrobiae bacterium]